MTLVLFVVLFPFVFAFAMGVVSSRDRGRDEAGTFAGLLDELAAVEERETAERPVSRRLAA